MADETPSPSQDPEVDTLDAIALVSLEDLCRSCNVEVGWIVALVEHGAIEPQDHDTQWQFSGHAVVRVAKAKRLERDLSLNPPGIALVLDLLDQIDELRSRLRVLDYLSR